MNCVRAVYSKNCPKCGGMGGFWSGDVWIPCGNCNGSGKVD